VISLQIPSHDQKLAEIQIMNRLHFCKKKINFPDSLSMIHFSDESRFVLGDDKKWIWDRKGEDNPSASISTNKFPQGIMVFAVIVIDYKSRLLIVNESIDMDKYLDNINSLGFIDDLDEKHGVLQWIYQQDGATYHTSQRAIEWIEGNCDAISDWPSNSPDLSPVELLCSILKASVQIAMCNNIAELKSAINIAWDSISQTIIDKLCKSFAKRLQACFDNDGKSISNLLFLACERADIVDEIVRKRSDPWTSEEDFQLLKRRKKHCNSWKLFEQLIPGRNCGEITNRWYFVLCKHMISVMDDIDKTTLIQFNLRANFHIPDICAGDQ
jgi:hypothetical protein